MREMILFNDGKVSMLYRDDCGCTPPKKKGSLFKWIGDMFTEFLKGLLRNPETLLS